jgi:hypothetical protein
MVRLGFELKAFIKYHRTSQMLPTMAAHGAEIKLRYTEWSL